LWKPQCFVQVRIVKNVPEMIDDLAISAKLIRKHKLDRSQHECEKCVVAVQQRGFYRVMAAAEVYFGNYWDSKRVRQSLTDIINAVQWASKRRDDIAHGTIIGRIVIDGESYGGFLVPPEYNTGRTFAFMGDDADPLRFIRAKYRYTASNIMEWQSKFGLLREAIWDYTIKIKRQDGRLPFADALLASPADKDEKKP
jgi:hypothetical protein